MAYADGVGAGRANTAIIIANQGYGDGISYAARICNEYSVNFGGVPYGDWYLPSKSELILLCGEKTVVGGFTTTPNNYYWSSTEVDVNKAWAVEFISCNPTMLNAKQSTYFVRAIRSF
jgi:hypothetical protein